MGYIHSSCGVLEDRMDIITGKVLPSHEPIHKKPRRVKSSHG